MMMVMAVMDTQGHCQFNVLAVGRFVNVFCLSPFLIARTAAAGATPGAAPDPSPVPGVADFRNVSWSIANWYSTAHWQELR